jgi:MFS superfamily sulfate permease-like transporter
MLPIFMIGVVVGIALAYAWFMYKKGTPSDIKLETLEWELSRQKSDNELLTTLNEKLYKKIETLETELKEYKK